MQRKQAKLDARREKRHLRIVARLKKRELRTQRKEEKRQEKEAKILAKRSEKNHQRQAKIEAKRAKSNLKRDYLQALEQEQYTVEAMETADHVPFSEESLPERKTTPRFRVITETDAVMSRVAVVEAKKPKKKVIPNDYNSMLADIEDQLANVNNMSIQNRIFREEL